MYYIMECPPLTNNKGEAQLEIHNHEEVGEVWDWKDGIVLENEERDSIPKPIEIRFDRFRGYKGPMREYIDVGTSLMSDRLKAALESFGVDNIEFFPARLLNSKSEEEIVFHAFKLVGLVAMADMTQSEHTVHDDRGVVDVSFKSLNVKSGNAQGMLIFRLAENINAVFVHHNLRDHLESAGIDTLKFIEPSDWVQL